MISSQSELINNKMIIWKLAFVRRFTIQCLIAVQTTWFTSNTTLPECQIDLYTTCQEFRTSLAPSSSTCALPKTSGDHALLFSQPLQVLKQLLFYPLAVIWQESMEGIVEHQCAYVDQAINEIVQVTDIISQVHDHRVDVPDFPFIEATDSIQCVVN